MKSWEVKRISRVNRSATEAERELLPFGPDMSGLQCNTILLSQGCLSPGFVQRRSVIERVLSFTPYTAVYHTPEWCLPRLFKVIWRVSQRSAHINQSLRGCILHSTCGLWGRREFSYLLPFIHRDLELLLTHTFLCTLELLITHM